MGGARTALFNYLYARQNNGKFVLRIEDTDQNRSSDEAINEITDSLEWLGLQWDEGPDIGGQYGPYKQTQKIDVHKNAAQQLLKDGHAYFCFCENRTGYSYPKTCRDLTPEQVEELKKQGIKPVLRLKVPASGSVTFNDLIRGPIAFDNQNIDDFVILRSDGSPTYNLAVVVDDHSMAISHVIRGDDHISNTPKQITLYNALGYALPSFAHLPLIIGADKKPLSKRHGSVAVGEFRRQGFLSDALINYMALLGWGFDEKTTFFTRSELIDKFSLEKVSKTPAAWDNEKLTWLNAEYIKKLPENELAQIIKDKLSKENIVETDTNKLEKIAVIIRERIKLLKDIVPLVKFFFVRQKLDEQAKEMLNKTEGYADVLLSARSKLEEIKIFKTEEIEPALRQLAIDLNLKPSKLFQLIRIIISGRNVSPPLFESLEILGKKETLSRLHV